MMSAGGATDYFAEIIAGLATVLSTVLGWLGVQLNGRVRELESQAVENAKTMVTRDELQSYIERATAERQGMHSENKGLLEKIFEKLDDHSELKEKVRRNEEDIARERNRIDNLQNRQRRNRPQ